MKVALVSYMLREDGQIPIGLLTLAAIARQEGVRDIRVFDLPARQEEEGFVRSLSDCEVVGFSSICSTYNQTVRLCRRLKAASPRTRIVLGGPQASLTAQASLDAFPFVDLIFHAEAENSWRAFLRSFQAPDSLAAIPGIVWRDGARTRQNPSAPVIQDLGTLPFPALDVYDFSPRASVTPVEIGRGCPFACSFCSSSPHFKRNFRLKPVQRILEELDRLHEAYGSRSFYFVQDSFSVKRSFVEEICAALRRHPRPYTWYCSARADQMPEKTVSAMKDAGCLGTYFGLETGSQRMQGVINKHLDVKEAVKVIQRTAAQGLEVTTSMIIGFPTEEAEDIAETLRVFLDLKAGGHALVQLHVLAPMIGSSLSSEGHALSYDGMPSDFADTTHVVDAEDGALIQQHPEIFASFWHYVNPAIPRRRFLFLAQFLNLASLYFPNTLCLGAKQSRDKLVDFLLNCDVPAPFHSDPTYPAGLDRWVRLTGEVFERFMRMVPPGHPLAHALEYDLAYNRAEVATPEPLVLRLPATIGPRPGRLIVDGLQDGSGLESYVIEKREGKVRVFRVDSEACPNSPASAEQDVATTIDEICASCGECCFEPGGILCGGEEWAEIGDALALETGRRPAAEPLEGGDLLFVNAYREMECPGASNGRTPQTRRACPALRLDGENHFRCSVESVKPSGCVAYPLKLVLRELTAGPARWLISLEFDGAPDRRMCPLEEKLRRSPELLENYRDHVRRRIGSRPATFALAAYNLSRHMEAEVISTGGPE